MINFILRGHIIEDLEYILGALAIETFPFIPSVHTNIPIEFTVCNSFWFSATLLFLSMGDNCKNGMLTGIVDVSIHFFSFLIICFIK